MTRRTLHRLILLAMLAGSSPQPAAVAGETSPAAPSSDLELWYDAPAEKWVEALPIGNGSLGAMIFGGVGEARYQFNIDTLWTGSPHSYVHPGAAGVLPRLRELLFAGDQRAAERLASERFMSKPLRQMAYQPCGDLVLEFPGQEAGADYRRALDLDAATATTTYRANGVNYTRRAFASYPAGAIIIELTCSEPGALKFTGRLTSPHADATVTAVDERAVRMTGRVREAASESADEPANEMMFAARLQVLETDGECDSAGGEIAVRNATRATLALTAATNFVDFRTLAPERLLQCDRAAEALVGRTFAQLHAEHLADYQPLFRRVSLDLGPVAPEQLPTDRRVVLARQQPDPALDALFFQYGRYLLLACSRPGSQPANLQGLWNDQLDPAWGSKYTTNINTEMNYWPAETANLPECAKPLFGMVRDVAVTGAETARVHYDADGWVLHHNTDLWRGTAPINASNHGIWPTGGAWLCQHLWEHYLFTQDEEFLRDTAYPLMKNSAAFFADNLVEDPRSEEHWLVSGPSNSPEQGGLVMGPTMDHQIIRTLFANTIAAAKQLQVDEEFCEQLAELRARIAPNRIGRLGQLQEWMEDADDPNNRHRHVSHLWGVFPGDEITPATPELFDAARVSLDLRGDGGTGWSRAWKVNLWARLRDGDRAYRVLHDLLQLTDSKLTDYSGGGVYANLFDAHPPFQIDGNFGAVSGMCEMLLQSHQITADGRPRLELLPALPAAWPTGSVAGLRARGGFEASLAWRDGKLAEAVLSSERGGSCRVECGATIHDVELAPGESITFADWSD
ncbi:MAG: glycoside hydrolase family 95 protein [Planctomycetales bacterium]|nr:glycoside hydrolase family 95 protein [Planctomycetales bacterium]